MVVAVVIARGSVWTIGNYYRYLHTIPLFLQVYDAEKDEYREFGRDYGYSLTAQDVPAALKTFFLRHRVHGSSGSALAYYIIRLEQLLSWFESQKVLTFRASSLLFVDGSKHAHHDVRAIDFAHTHLSEEDGECDQGYIHGLHVLLSMLRDMQANHD